MSVKLRGSRMQDVQDSGDCNISCRKLYLPADLLSRNFTLLSDGCAPRTLKPTQVRYFAGRISETPSNHEMQLKEEFL
jgi:hypothetical protein